MNTNKQKTSKISGLNVTIIGVISFLYILLITKLAEMFSSSLGSEDNEEYSINNKEQISMYVMIIYFISIMGIIVGYIWFSEKNINNKLVNETPNWIIRWSLSIGGVLMLIYTIINYWDYLGNYPKILLIFLSITSIIYYLYKYF